MSESVAPPVGFPAPTGVDAAERLAAPASRTARRGAEGNRLMDLYLRWSDSTSGWLTGDPDGGFPSRNRGRGR